MNGNVKDMTAKRVGRLTAIERAGTNKHGSALWLFRCDCGKTVVALGASVRAGNTTSCGCFNKERTTDTHTTHGDAATPLYSVWSAMHQRCNNPKVSSFKHYGGRGITVCAEWYEYASFRRWAVNNGYQLGLQIDRKDNDGPYSPWNCRFVTRAENCRNRRTSINVLVDGITLTAGEWAREIGVNHNLVRYWVKKHGNKYAEGRIREKMRNGVSVRA